MNHFQDFTHFLDSIGLTAEWLPSDGETSQRAAEEAGLDDVREPNRVVHEQSTRPHKNPGESRGDSPFRSWLPSVPRGDQSLGTLSDSGKIYSILWFFSLANCLTEPPQIAKRTSRFNVTEDQRFRLAASLEQFRHVILDFVLPSRHTLTRYLTSYFDGFHPHLPFIHIPTFRINEHSPELVLALMTIGAQYRFEHRNADRIYRVSKAILFDRLASRSNHSPKPRHDSNNGMSVPFGARRYSSHGDVSPGPADEYGSWRQIEIIRCLLVLMGYSTWENAELVQEAFTLQSLLVRHLRGAGLSENTSWSDPRPSLEWHEWADKESTRRTKLISFCFIHMHSVSYNAYPSLRSSEIHLRLPCSTSEWTATTAGEWEAAQRNRGAQQLFFQDALTLLLQKSHSKAVLDPIPAPLGNYILLHGLLQRIHLVSELSLPNGNHGSATLPTEELNKLE